MGGIFRTLIVSSLYFSDAEGNNVEFRDRQSRNHAAAIPATPPTRIRRAACMRHPIPSSFLFGSLDSCATFLCGADVGLIVVSTALLSSPGSLSGCSAATCEGPGLQADLARCGQSSCSSYSQALCVSAGRGAGQRLLRMKCPPLWGHGLSVFLTRHFQFISSYFIGTVRWFNRIRKPAIPRPATAT